MTRDSMSNSKSIVAIQLPSLFPDVAWLRNLVTADFLVIQDHIPFSRKSRVHRGKIRTPDGIQWIHIPIHPDDRDKSLHLCRLDLQSDWLTPLWRSIEFNYRNSIYFDFYEDEILALLHDVTKVTTFAEAHNILFLTWISLLEIVAPKFVYSSSKLNQITADKSDPLDFIPEIESAGLIIRESHSKNYQPPIHRSVEIQKELPVYHQHFDGFEPNCSLLDLLFQNGPESWRILDELKLNQTDISE